MATSFSSATFTSTAAERYDVFINHRGSDVRNTFARSLYLRLLQKGLKPFLDQDEVRSRYSMHSEIKHVIKTASVHVAIFSLRYAESTSCLDELLLMLESKAPIIPVFYRVTPGEVRGTQGGHGKYAYTLTSLAKKRKGNLRYDSNTIEKWRSALSQVADNFGFELEVCNGEELELLDKVVNYLSKTFKRQPQLDVSWDEKEKKFAKIGLDEKVKDFESKVLSGHHQRANPQVVGIVGPGGVGKTTLAKELFHNKRSDYSRSCILSDVRENASKGLLTSLQSQLLKCLTASDKLIDSIDEGKEALRKHLPSFPVLVILDDVDHLNQVDALLPIRIDLLLDSLIVITSRDKGVIISSGVEISLIYNLTGLSILHSQELFCRHAFSQPYPRPGFESLVHKFVETCDGLPLSLKVLGAHLYGEYNLSHWENVLNRFFLLPNEIQESIKISYENLNMEQEHIFLDIACFFIGQKRNTAIRIWNGSGWNGLLGFQNLENKCLVEVDSENIIHMHDHIRDFGREVAAETTPLPRRLWRCTSINDMLEQLSNEPGKGVRGIRMVRSDYHDDDDAFVGMATRTLQLLDTEDGLLERILKRVKLPNLIWLRWNKCPNSSLPWWIPMESLSVLQVSGSVLETLWEDEQVPWQLQELEINAPLANIPKSIQWLKRLERIVVGKFLSGQVNLTKLPEEFCYLRSLKDFVLTECSKMKSLPRSFGYLWELQHIDLSFCRNLESLPDLLGDLSQLQRINLSDCHDLERLPDSIGYLGRLQHIDLQGCHNLERLPDSFGNLKDLRHINLSGCHDLQKLPDSFGNLRYLQHIDLQGCHNLEELPISFGDLMNLQHINLSNCHSLERLPDSFGNLSDLQYVDFSGCHNLERLPNYFRNLNKLRYLDVEGCSNLVIETIEISANLQVTHQRHLKQLFLSDA